MVNFRRLAAEICWRVCGTPDNFNGCGVLAALLHGTLVVGVSQTLRRWTEGATYIRQGGHYVGHWPTFLLMDEMRRFHIFRGRLRAAVNQLQPGPCRFAALMSLWVAQWCSLYGFVDMTFFNNENRILLWSPYVIGQTIIFLPCDFYLSFCFSSPNLSGRRLDVYHSSTHGVA